MLGVGVQQLLLVPLLLATTVSPQTSPKICPNRDTSALSSGLFPAGSTISFSCPKGFIGKATATCLIDGTWDNRPFKPCTVYGPANGSSAHDNGEDLADTGRHKIAKGCPWPTDNVPDYPVGTNLTIECPFGYYIQSEADNSTRKVNVGTSCNSTTTRVFWTRSNITNCISRTGGGICNLPHTPRNGRIYTRSPTISGKPRGLLQFRRGAFIRYECLDGYNLYGPARIICLDDGDWSSEPPRCL